MQSWTAKSWVLDVSGTANLWEAANAWVDTWEGAYSCYAKDVKITKACDSGIFFAFQVRMEVKCCNGDYCKSDRAFWEYNYLGDRICIDCNEVIG